VLTDTILKREAWIILRGFPLKVMPECAQIWTV
jgi:hypothetical protein